MSMLDDVLGYFDKKKEECYKEDTRLAAGQKREAASKVNQTWFDKMTDRAWDELKTGPLAQLGKDFLAEQIVTNGNQLLSNAGNQLQQKVGSYVKGVEDVKDIVFNSVALAMTAQNQMGLFFMQQVANQAIKAIHQKREALQHLQESLRQLYNALVILVAGQPFFNTYLARLRRALIYIYQAQGDIFSVMNSLQYRNSWQPKKLERAKLNIEEALTLIEPDNNGVAAQFVGKINLLFPVNLSVRQYIRLEIDGVSQEFSIAGANPAATTRDEIITKINRAFAKPVATVSGSSIKILSPKKGTFSRIIIQNPKRGEATSAIQVVFGLSTEKSPHTFTGQNEEFKGARFNDSGLLANVGIPKEPQQLTTLIAIPKLCKDVALAMNGYLIANLKLNGLLLAFCNGYDELLNVSTGFISKFSVETLRLINGQLETIIADMATFLNGSPDAVMAPLQGFAPESVRVSAYSLEWVVRLRVAYELLRAIPGKALDMLESDNVATKKYRDAVKKIKAMGSVTNRGATLVAIEGREEPGQMERQVVFFLLEAMKSTVSGTASKTVLTAGKQLVFRTQLSLDRDQEIENILKEFSTADLGFSNQLKTMGSSIEGVLRNAGLDRAADSLKNGQFSTFFNLDNKTMTYAGGALTGFSFLKKCLDNDVDKQKINNAELVARREQQYRTLMARRSVSTGYSVQRENLKKKCRANEGHQDNVKQVTKTLTGPCGVEFPFSGTGFLDGIGPALGLTAFNTGTAQAALKKYGRGIL